MRKQTKTLLFLFLGVLLVVLALFLVQSAPRSQADGDSEPDPSFYLWEHEPSALLKIEVYTIGEDYTILMDENGEAVLEGLADLPKNQSAYDTAREIHSLKAARIVSDTSEKDAEFGLLPAGHTIHVYFEGEETPEVIEIGDDSPDGRYYYVKWKNDNTSAVYAVPVGALAAFTQKKTHYITKDIAPFSSRSAEMQVLEIDLVTGGAEGEISVEPITPDNSTSLSSGLLMTKPFVREVSLTQTEELLQLAQVLQGEIVKIHPDDTMLSEYGLSVPQKSMRVKYREKGVQNAEEAEYRILVGDSVEIGNYTFYYVMCEGTEIIYRVPEQSIAWIDYTAENLMTFQVYKTNIDALSTLEIVGEENSHIFHFSGEQSRGTLRVLREDESEVTVADFTQLYQLIGGGSGTAVTESTYVPKGEPALTLRATFREEGREPLVITFYHESGYEAFAVPSDLPLSGRAVVVPYAYVLKILEIADMVEKGDEVYSIIW